MHRAAVHPYGIIPGTKVREPITGREDIYRPWETPPTARAIDSPEVAAHQEEVNAMHTSLFELIPFKLSPVAEAFARQNILPDENSAGYQGHHEARLITLPELELTDEELAIYHELEPKIQIGTATMAEVAAHSSLVKRRTGELAMLRTIGGYRSQYENPMMKEAVETLGEGFKRGTRRKLAITGFDSNFFSDQPIDAFSFGYKRPVGVLPDGTEVGARYSFAVDVNPENGFDPSLRDAIQNIAQDQPWDIIPQFQRPKALIEEIMKKGPAHPQVIGAVIKLYMFNREVDAEITKRTKEMQGVAARREKYGESATDSTKMLHKVAQPKLQD